MEKDRIEQFLRDASGFCESLRHALSGLEKEPNNRDLVHQAFRYVHSLKSEAQFLELDELGAVAHEMEGVLEQLRQGAIPADADSLGILVQMVDAFEEMLSGVESPEPAAPETRESPAETGRAPIGNGISEAPDDNAVNRVGSGPLSAMPHFTDFERELINEARSRGESFYRMTCEIEDSAPLKYPKAYLVVNNLELTTTVIRSVPSFDTTDDGAFRLFDVFFTASINEQAIRESVDVDQVSIRTLGEIAYQKLEESGQVPPAQRKATSTMRGPSSIRVEHGRLDEISRRLHGLRLAVEHLRKLGGRDESGGERRLAGIADEIPRIERLVCETRQVPFSEEFRHVPWLVQDLAGRLGKRIRLVITGEAVRIDRRLLSLLSEPLVHLVRNAVDHGIEGGEERTSVGKEPEGIVTISAIAREGEVVLQVGDDGRGIARSVVEARARELGFDIQSGDGGSPVSRNSLLDLLVRPGFSTRSEATAVSGRGVGLDAIYQKVHQSLGGELRLQTQEGKGSLFTISVPGGSSMVSLLMVRCGKGTVGIPLRDIESIVEVDSTALTGDAAGSLSFEDSVVRYARGVANREVFSGGIYPLILLKRGAERIPFLCDEVLFERDVPEERLILDDTAPHGIRGLRIGEIAADYSLLDVSVIG